MRIADSYIQEVIDSGGTMPLGVPVSREAVLRLALDLRQARDLLRQQTTLLAEIGVELARREGLIGRKITDYRA